MGDSLAVEHRTLTPRTLVRIQVPQPAVSLEFLILEKDLKENTVANR